MKWGKRRPEKKRPKKQMVKCRPTTCLISLVLEMVVTMHDVCISCKQLFSPVGCSKAQNFFLKKREIGRESQSTVAALCATFLFFSLFLFFFLLNPFFVSLFHFSHHFYWIKLIRNGLQLKLVICGVQPCANNALQSTAISSRSNSSLVRPRSTPNKEG
jgi:hypothetical protein